ncbi:MAG: hypothetical protein ABIJ45_13190, partial [Candidatus Zixiibacteriota bacterium]
MKSILAFLLILVIPVFLFSDNYTDSLTNLLKTEKSAKKRIELNNIISDWYIESDPDKAIEYAEKAIRESKNNKIDTMMSESYSLIGIAYKNKGDSKKALNFHFKSLKEEERIKNKIDMANT